MVKWVKPTGDMTPARPETAAWSGNRAQATVRGADGTVGTLGLVRDLWAFSEPRRRLGPCRRRVVGEFDPTDPGFDPV